MILRQLQELQLVWCSGLPFVVRISCVMQGAGIRILDSHYNADGHGSPTEDTKAAEQSPAAAMDASHGDDKQLPFPTAAPTALAAEPAEQEQHVLGWAPNHFLPYLHALEFPTKSSVYYSHYVYSIKSSQTALHIGLWAWKDWLRQHISSDVQLKQLTSNRDIEFCQSYIPQCSLKLD